MTAPAPTAHHPLGPSNWPAWTECADFTPEVDDVDDAEASAIAVEAGEVEPDKADEDDEDQTPAGRGRLQHAATATILLRRPQEEIDAALAPLTERETLDVHWVAERTREIVLSHGLDPLDLICEERVTMVGPDMRILYFGTCDARTGPLRFEWKFGLERNYFPQLVGYSLPELEDQGGGRIIAYVVYGMLHKSRQHVIDLETARTVGYGVLRRRTADVRPPAPCQYCGFCAKKLTCAAVTQLVTQLTTAREDWPSEVLRLDQAHVSLATQDPVWLGKARWLWKYHLEKWGAAVEWATKMLAEGGTAPLGFKIGTTTGKRGIVNAYAAAELLKREGVPAAAVEPALKASFGPLAKVLAAHEGISEAKAKVRLEHLLIDAGLLKIGPAGIQLRQEPDGFAKLAAASEKAVMP